MVSLTDILPTAASVTVGGKEIPIYGISLPGIAAVMRRFPEIVDKMRALYEESEVAKAAGKEYSIGYAELVTLLGPALGAFIAAGCGYAGDQAQEQAAERLPIDMQIEFLAPIIERTMPDGIGPFVERLKAIAQGLRTKVESIPQEASTPHTKSRKRASG